MEDNIYLIDYLVLVSSCVFVRVGERIIQRYKNPGLKI